MSQSLELSVGDSIWYKHRRIYNKTGRAADDTGISIPEIHADVRKVVSNILFNLHCNLINKIENEG